MQRETKRKIGSLRV